MKYWLGLIIVVAIGLAGSAASFANANNLNVEAAYTIEQVIDGTVAEGDGSNPRDNDITGLHDAGLPLGGFDFALGPRISSSYGQLENFAFAEWRCAVFPEVGHTPSVDFRINVQAGAYYRFTNGRWNKGVDAFLNGGGVNNGAYFAHPGFVGNPFDAGTKGLIDWRQEADGSFSAPWNHQALNMHFWDGARVPIEAGQTAEFLTSEIRLQQPDGKRVDLSSVRVLGQCGVDYYQSNGGEGTKVPGPGIGKYHLLSEQWTPSLYLSLPDVPNSVEDFRDFHEANPIPGVITGDEVVAPAPTPAPAPAPAPGPVGVVVGSCSVSRNGVSAVVSWDASGEGVDRFVVSRSVDGSIDHWRGVTANSRVRFVDSDRVGDLVYSVEAKDARGTVLSSVECDLI